MTKKRLIEWILIVILFAVLFAPFIYTIFFSIPVGDDFKMAFLANQYPDENLFYRAIKVANFFYLNWGGSWTEFFLQILLNPLLIFSDPLRSIGLEMVCFFLFFLSSIIVLVHCVSKYIFNCNDAIRRAVIELIIVGSVLVSNGYYEVFYWFTGASYCRELCFAMLFVAALLCELKKNKNIVNRIALFIFGIVASQSLCLDIPLGLLVLVAAVYEKTTRKNDIKLLALLLIMMVLSGCSAAFAPGNFVRYGRDVGSIDVIWSVKHTILVGVDETVGLLANRAVLICYIMLFCTGMASDTRVAGCYEVLIILVLMGLSVFGILLPVNIGYGGGAMPNRVDFLYNVIFILYSSFLILSLGSALGKKIPEKKWVCIGTLMLSVVFFALNVGYVDSAHYKASIHAADARAESEGYKAIYREIEKSKGDVIIVIDPDSIPCSGIIAPPCITSSTDNFVNIGVAQYYGINSLKFEWE